MKRKCIKKTIKKITVFLSAVVMVVNVPFGANGLTLCSRKLLTPLEVRAGETEKNCDHLYGDVYYITKYPTCTTDGEKMQACIKCYEYAPAPVKATGHTIIETPAVEPSGITPGKTKRQYCLVCSEIVKAEEVVYNDGLNYYEDNYYYYNSKTKEFEYGLKNIDGNNYYFDEDNNGKAVIGEKKIGNVEYLFGSDGKGYNGWYTKSYKSYWYENGIRQGYKPEDSSYRGKEIYDPESMAWYWLDNIDEGARAENKQVYQESVADDKGTIGKWVFYDYGGYMAKGLRLVLKDDGKFKNVYYDLTYGSMKKGSFTVISSDESRINYFADYTTGEITEEIYNVPETGWKEYYEIIETDSETGRGKYYKRFYWFENYERQGVSEDPSYRGKEIYDPGTDAWYWLDNCNNGLVAKSKDVYQESLAGECGEYVGEDGQKYGKWVRYDSEGHMVKGWHYKDGNIYYFDPVYGTMAKGNVQIDGKNYHFNEITGVYDGEERLTYGVGVESHTKDEILAYMDSHMVESKNASMVRDVNVEPPYDFGRVSDDSLNDAISHLNIYRYIAGLKPVEWGEQYRELAQAGAYSCYLNRELSHYQTAPADMDENMKKTFESGPASSNICSSSNLILSLDLYMADSDRSNISRVGHRRWILNPQMRYTAFGSTGKGYSAMYAFDRGYKDEKTMGVIWPAGNTPTKYFDKNSAWSYSLGTELKGDVRVTVDGSGGVWNFSSDNSDGDFYVNNGGYGQTGCVIFRPSGIDVSSGNEYWVKITQDGVRIAEYKVCFFE